MSILFGTLPENCVFSLACPPVDFRSLPAMSLRYVADRDEPLALWRVHLNVCCQIWTILTEQAQMLSVDLPSIYLPQDCEPFGKLSRFIDLQCRDVGVHDHLRKVLPGFSLSGVVDGDIRYRLLYSSSMAPNMLLIHCLGLQGESFNRDVLIKDLLGIGALVGETKAIVSNHAVCPSLCVQRSIGMCSVYCELSAASMELRWPDFLAKLPTRLWHEGRDYPLEYNGRSLSKDTRLWKEGQIIVMPGRKEERGGEAEEKKATAAAAAAATTSKGGPSGGPNEVITIDDNEEDKNGTQPEASIVNGGTHTASITSSGTSTAPTSATTASTSSPSKRTGDSPHSPHLAQGATKRTKPTTPLRGQRAGSTAAAAGGRTST